MSATTAEAIRARIVTVTIALTPTSHSREKFREHTNEGDADFEEWCEQNADAAFRVFRVLETGGDDPPEVSSGTDEERAATFTITVAYPHDGRAGAAATARHALMREDQRIIERAVGMHGKANFTSPYPDATWLLGGSSTERVLGSACDFLVITQSMLFDTSW